MKSQASDARKIINASLDDESIALITALVGKMTASGHDETRPGNMYLSGFRSFLYVYSLLTPRKLLYTNEESHRKDGSLPVIPYLKYGRAALRLLYYYNRNFYEESQYQLHQYSSLCHYHIQKLSR